MIGQHLSLPLLLACYPARERERIGQTDRKPAGYVSVRANGVHVFVQIVVPVQAFCRSARSIV